jgi:uncharacterized protein involved in exopolysaccharide biosynthesis
MGQFLVYINNDRKVFMLVFSLVVLLFVFLASRMQPLYTASATLVFSGPDLNADETKSSEASSLNVADQIALSGARALTLTNLRAVAAILYADSKEKPDRATLDGAAQSLRKDIDVDYLQSVPGNGSSTFGFTVSYQNPDPARAADVLGSVVRFYLDDSEREGMRSLGVALGLLEAEEQRLQKEAVRLSEEIAEFKRENAANLPELHAYNISYMASIKKELTEINRQIIEHEQRRRKLVADLAATQPDDYIYTQDNKRLYTPGEQLELLEAELVSKQKLYASAHPDMVSLQRKIEALHEYVDKTGGSDSSPASLKTEKEMHAQSYDDIGNENSSSDMPVRSGANDGKAIPARRSSNPVYLRMSSELESFDREMQALQVQRSDLQDSIKRHEKLISSEPEIARQYEVMSTAYQNAVSRLTEIRERMFETRLNIAVADGGGGSRYVLVEEPQVPDIPNSRKRSLMVVFGALIALALGALVSIVRGIRNEVIFDVGDLKEIADNRVVLSVPDYSRMKFVSIS